MSDVALPSNAITRRIINGVYTEGVTYTSPENMSAADTLDFAVVPAGARLLGIKVKSDTAIAGTIDIGDGTTADRFLDGSAALATAELVGSANEQLGDVLSTTADTTLTITFITAAPATGDVITAWAEITNDALTAHSGLAA